MTTKSQSYSLCSQTICTGLELEYEEVSHKSSYAALSASHNPREILWHSKSDGSLRPRDVNTELIFIKPLAGEKVLSALDQLESLSKLKYQISWRCGMHVHVDHRGMSFRAAYKELVLACLLEGALFEWAGLARKESKFCSPITDVYAHLWDNGEAVIGRTRFTPSKYVSLNLAPIYNTGSVELRCADSTRDIPRMVEYINIGMGIRLLAEEFPTSFDMIESLLSSKSLNHWLDANAPREMAAALQAHAVSDKYLSSTSAQAAVYLAEREILVPDAPI